MSSAADKRHETMCRLAHQAFETHEIIRRGEGRWTIRRADGRGFHWADIACLGQYVIVVGDIDTCVFRGSSSNRPDHLVHWLASTDSYGYLAQKAHVGMGSDRDVYSYDADVVLDQLREWRGESDDPEAQTEIDTIIADLDDYAHNEGALYHALYEAGVWDGDGYVGRVVAARIYYAHAAVRRLSALLKAEKAKSKQRDAREVCDG